MVYQWDIGNTTLAFATLVLAAVSLCASYWSVQNSNRLTRETLSREGLRRVAEIRVKWVEEVRSNLSSFVSITSVCRRGATDEQRQEIFIRKETLDLWLNPQNPLHEAVRDAMQEVVVAVSEGDGPAHFASHGKFFSAARAMLKAEWEDIKEDAIGKVN